MADISIIFNGAKNTGTENSELEVFANTMNNITISLKNKDAFSEYPEIIQLSKSTAIKLHRELKKQNLFFRKRGKQWLKIKHPLFSIQILMV